MPYIDLREDIGHSQEQFVLAWQTSLKAASDDYTHRVRLFWRQIFNDLFMLSGGNEQEQRGLPHYDAVQLYASNMAESRSRDMFTIIKKVHLSVSMNVEKFDKRAVARGDKTLTSTLIPQLHSAPFVAYPTLEGHVETLRDLLVMKEEEEEPCEDFDMHSIRHKVSLTTKDSVDMRRRADEMFWLHDMLARGIPNILIPKLVAHRGELLWPSMYIVW